MVDKSTVAGSEIAEANIGKPSVVIVGGGYGGINLARALDDHAHVLLIEPKRAFHHNVAALRALVDADWTERSFFPYDRLLANGRVIHDRAVEVGPEHIALESGERLTPDFIVLATGSAYPFPAKSDHVEAEEAIEAFRTARAELAQADRVMIVGAGAAGLELAGEIAAAWPDKRIILVDAGQDILPGGYDQALREEIHRQLDGMRVVRVLGSPLAAFPDVEPARAKTFTVTTAAGAVIEADIWFRAYGTTPRTGYLTGDLAAARRADGYIDVTPDLRVAGVARVFAVGDIVAIDTDKAGIAGRQAQVVAANIRAAIGNGDPVVYVPGRPSIVLPLGPRGGAGQTADGEFIDAARVSALKGRDMFVDRYAQLLGR